MSEIPRCDICDSEMVTSDNTGSGWRCPHADEHPFTTDEVSMAFVAATVARLDSPFTEEQATEGRRELLVETLTNILNDDDPAGRVESIREKLIELRREFYRLEARAKAKAPGNGEPPDE